MKIDKFGVYSPLLKLENGQNIEEINLLIENNNLNGLRVVSNRITPLNIKTLDILKETTFIKNISWWVFDNIENYDFLYNYNELEKLHLQNAPLGNLDIGLLPKTLIELRTYWNENISFSNENLSIKTAQIIAFKEKDCQILKKFKVLNDLSFSCDKRCKSLKGLEEIKSLERLGVSAPFKELGILSKLTNLKSFTINGFKIKNLKELSDLKRLKILCLSSRTIIDISNIAKLENLKALSIIGCWKLEDFSAIRALKKLKYLEIEDCKKLKSIEFVSDLPNLEQLKLSGTTVVNDYNLKPAKNIKSVYIQDYKKQYNLDVKYKPIKGKNNINDYFE